MSLSVRRREKEVEMTTKDEALEKVLAAIKSYESLPYGPTRRELAEITGIPLSIVQTLVTYLASEGRIHYTESIARSIRLKTQ